MLFIKGKGRALRLGGEGTKRRGSPGRETGPEFKIAVVWCMLQTAALSLKYA